MSSPNSNITQSTLSTMYETFTYTVSGNSINKILNGVSSNAQHSQFTQQDNVMITYQDQGVNTYVGTYTKTYTGQSNPFQYGSYTGSSLAVTPLNLAMLANRTITLSDTCTDGSTHSMQFSADGTSAIDCANALSVNTTTMPGVLIVTNNSGLIQYLGLLGTSITKGARFGFITENPGAQNLPAWGKSADFVSIQ